MAQRVETLHLHAGSPKTFTDRDETYTLIRFPKGNSPSFPRALAIAEEIKGMEMLTEPQAKQIRFDAVSDAAFNAMRPGDKTYVRDPKSEAGRRVAILGRSSYNRKLYVGRNVIPKDIRTLLLRHTSEASAESLELALELAALRHI